MTETNKQITEETLNFLLFKKCKARPSIKSTATNNKWIKNVCFWRFFCSKTLNLADIFIQNKETGWTQKWHCWENQQNIFGYIESDYFLIDLMC